MRTIFLFFVMIAVLFSSCKTTATLPVEKAKLDDTEWVLESLRKKEMRYDEEIDKIEIKFNTESGMLSGQSGCNQYFGKFTVQNNQIRIIDPIGSTRKICFQELMTLENSYLNTLKLVNKFEITEGKLLLFQHENVILTFSQKPQIN